MQQLDFQRFLFSRPDLSVSNDSNYMEKANEGVVNLIKNFSLMGPLYAFEFAWNKSSRLARSAVLLVAKQDYPDLFKQTSGSELAENFSEDQKQVLQEIMKDVAADLIGACSMMDFVAGYYLGLKGVYEQDPEMLLKNLGPGADVEFIYLQNQAQAEDTVTEQNMRA